MNLEFTRGRFDEKVPEKYDTPFFTFETSYGPVGLVISSEEDDNKDGRVVTTIQVWATDFSVSGKTYAGNVVYGVHPGKSRFFNEKNEPHVDAVEVLCADGKLAPAGVQAKFLEVAGICFWQATGVQGILMQSLLYRRFKATVEAKREMDEAIAKAQSLKATVDAGKVEMKRLVEMIEKKTATPEPKPDVPAVPPARSRK